MVQFLNHATHFMERAQRKIRQRVDAVNRHLSPIINPKICCHSNQLVMGIKTLGRPFQHTKILEYKLVWFNLDLSCSIECTD